jgi:hypothetical protein
MRGLELFGAPGVIRTPDLLVRSHDRTLNQQLAALPNNAQDQAFSNTSGARLVKLINAAMHGVGILLGIPESIPKRGPKGISERCRVYNPNLPALFSRNRLPSLM